MPVLVELAGELSKPERTPLDDLLRQIAGDTGPKNLPTADDEPARKQRGEAWAAWWKKVDGVGLLEEFRSRSLTTAQKTEVTEMIRKLGDGNYRVREKTVNDLVAMGAKVLADLRVAAKDPDGERAKRAADCIDRINRADGKRVPIGSARLVAMRRPPDAAEALLGFAPYADDDDAMLSEIRLALVRLVRLPNGNVEPALLKALEDPIALRRAMAVEAVARLEDPSVREAVKKKYRDTDLLVRQAAGVALVSQGEKDAVGVLISLLGELPVDKSWPTQDLLHQIAGENAPLEAPGETPAEREKYRKAWATWWQANEAKIDLAKLHSSPSYLGYTLVIEVGGNSTGRVAEINRDGKVRWQIPNLKYPVDAFVLPGERVLVTEWDGNRVSEYDFRGNLLWEKKNLTGRATNAQRLVNGNTFICTTSELLEVTREGKEVVKIPVTQGLTAGYKAANGDLICIRNDGQIARYDSSGKELKIFPSNRDTSWTSGIDLTRNGNILVSQPSPKQKVTEFTAEGKVVREWNTTNVTTATKLLSGGILVASHGGRNVIEYDLSGKQVWEYKSEFNVFRAKRR